MIGFEVKIVGLDSVRKLLATDYFSPLLQTTVEQEAHATRQDLIRVVGRETGLPEAKAGGFLRVRTRSSDRDASAEIQISPKAIPLTDYQPTVAVGTVSVSADISAQSGRGIRVLRGAFHPRGHRVTELYERVRRGGKRVGRYPIRVATGPSMAYQAGQLWPAQERITAERLSETAYDKLIDELQRRGAS